MDVKDYARDIDLHEEYIRPERIARTDKLLTTLLTFFIAEAEGRHSIPEDEEAKKKLLRALLNVRQAKVLPENILSDLNSFLWSGRLKSKVVECGDIPVMLSHARTNISVWRGDITRLNCEAIVNAANKELQGCFIPMHMCIDNAIHSAAGVQVRNDCAKIVAIQGSMEKTGDAKITRAYNLPSRYILHTVGPIVQGNLQTHHKELLASCYISCLDLATALEDINSIAFCCISTGVFGFPGEEAADVAIDTVLTWLNKNNHHFKQIIFNVFTEKDHERYARKLGERYKNI